jgi:hypothetical protein
MKKKFSQCVTRTLLAIVILFCSSLIPTAFIAEPVLAATTQGLSVTAYEYYWSGDTGMSVTIVGQRMLP